MKTQLTQEQILAIRCAHTDLIGAKQAVDSGYIYSHDWEVHEESIIDLENAFKELFLRELNLDKL